MPRHPRPCIPRQAPRGAGRDPCFRGCFCENRCAQSLQRGDPSLLHFQDLLISENPTCAKAPFGSAELSEGVPDSSRTRDRKEGYRPGKTENEPPPLFGFGETVRGIPAPSNLHLCWASPGVGKESSPQRSRLCPRPLPPSVRGGPQEAEVVGPLLVRQSGQVGGG